METPGEIILGHLNPHPLGLVKGMASKSQGGVSQESTHQERDAPMAFITPSRAALKHKVSALRTSMTLEAESHLPPVCSHALHELLIPLPYKKAYQTSQLIWSVSDLMNILSFKL